MARLNIDRQKKLEPVRVEKAIKEISKLGYKVKKETDVSISFVFKSNKIMFFPYSGWHSGKGIKDGRGLKKLLDQIKKPG